MRGQIGGCAVRWFQTTHADRPWPVLRLLFVMGVLLMATADGCSGNRTTSAGPIRPQTAQRCGGVDIRPQSSDLAASVTATGTTCAEATALVLAGPDVDNPGFGRNYTANGYVCVAGPETQPPGGGMSKWSYRCTNQQTGASVSFDRYP